MILKDEPEVPSPRIHCDDSQPDTNAHRWNWESRCLDPHLITLRRTRSVGPPLVSVFTAR
jgi:hypothetical protein